MDGSQPAATPAAEPARRSGLGIAVPLVVLLVLIGLGGVTSFIGLFFPWASANCGETDTHPICDTDTQAIIALGPMAAAGIGAVLGIIGCVRWPRDQWVYWMLAAYSVTLIGFFLFYGITSSAP